MYAVYSNNIVFGNSSKLNEFKTLNTARKFMIKYARSMALVPTIPLKISVNELSCDIYISDSRPKIIWQIEIEQINLNY